MASVSGVSNNNMSSLYGNRNVLSGMASGMDTESMIENSVKGIQLRIQSLQQKQVMLGWKQEAYQSITDKMIQFSRKYTSYTSATNLLSSSFFNKAVTTTTTGTNAAYVSATGKSNSTIEINGVAQLATASRYQASGVGVLSTVKLGDSGKPCIEAGTAVDLLGQTLTSNLSGSLTLNYGNKSVSLSFSSSEVYANADAFATAIRQKLADQTITFNDGTSKPADQVIGVNLSGEAISFTDSSASGNEVYISAVSGKLAETFQGTDFSATAKEDTLDLTGKDLSTAVQIIDEVGGKSMTFTLDGLSKNITAPTETEVNDYATANSVDVNTAFVALMNTKLEAAFGSRKIEASNEYTDTSKLQLRYTVGQGSSLTLNSITNEKLGFSKTESSYLNTSKTLGDLLGTDMGGLAGGVLLTAEGAVTQQQDGSYRDAKGNLVNSSGERLGTDGNLLYGHELKLNGNTIGTYTRDTALESVLVGINSNTQAAVSVSYSKTTNQFVFTSKETGSGHEINWGAGLAESIFGTFQSANYTQGKDAIVNMTVNGSNLTATRSSNTFDVDGMSVTVSGTFNGTVDAGGTPSFQAGDPVSFTTKSDADKIVGAIKTMVEDYNTIMKELREAYSTLPAQRANGSKYEPLTDEDRESMSETAIKNYEDKAKQGILFGDSDLSSLYQKFRSAIAPSGSDGAILRSMGLTTDYYKGLTTLSLDETKLRDMLSTNPDAVRDAFSKVAGEGSQTNGLMQNLKTHLDSYTSVEGTKGILINKAGSKYSATSLLKNGLKDQIDEHEKNISKWQDKLSSKVDYYTRQFTRLEQLISQMNSQSSAIAGFMGQG